MTLYTTPNDKKVDVAASVLWNLAHFRQVKPTDTEKSGVLIGGEFDNRYTITQISEPQPTDINTRFYTKRNEQGHQEAVNRAWEKSNGLDNYWGEWHIHPEAYPNASHLDLEWWRKLSSEVTIDRAFLFFVIVGLKDIAVYHLDRGSLAITKLVEDE